MRMTENREITGSVLVIILLTSEQLQMKHQLVLIAVGHQPQRKEHIVMLTGGLPL